MTHERSTLAVAMISRIMKPIIWLMVRHGISLQSFIDITKHVYVKVAEEMIVAEHKKPTDSQISLLTGVHRKDVRLLRDESLSQGQLSDTSSACQQLVAAWVGDDAYLDGQQNPRPLPYGMQGDEISFSHLAAAVSSDIRPRALLDALVQLGYVQIDEVTQIVTLQTESFVPNADKDNRLYFWGRNGADHLMAATQNVLAHKPHFMDRAVYHDGLTDESIRELRKIATESSMKVLRHINQKAFEFSTRDQASTAVKNRFTLGTFFYEERENPALKPEETQ